MGPRVSYNTRSFPLLYTSFKLVSDKAKKNVRLTEKYYFKVILKGYYKHRTRK